MISHIGQKKFQMLYIYMCRLVFLSHEELLSLQRIIYIGRSESLQLPLEFILSPSVDFSPLRGIYLSE